MFEFKPDYEQSKARMDAFWECELIDRPVVQFHLSKPLGECVPVPASNHSTSAEWWLDAEYQAELALAQLTNQEFLGFLCIGLESFVRTSTDAAKLCG